MKRDRNLKQNKIQRSSNDKRIQPETSLIMARCTYLDRNIKENRVN